MYMFGLHDGHLSFVANEIAKRHGAAHINYTDAHGRRRGWFVCADRGLPFDQAIARAVMADIEAAGGVDVLRHKRDRHKGGA